MRKQENCRMYTTDRFLTIQIIYDNTFQLKIILNNIILFSKTFSTIKELILSSFAYALQILCSKTRHCAR